MGFQKVKIAVRCGEDAELATRRLRPAPAHVRRRLGRAPRRRRRRDHGRSSNTQPNGAPARRSVLLGAGGGGSAESRSSSESIGFHPGYARRTDTLLRRLRVGEPPLPGSVPGRPFDITEYTQAAATIRDAAKQLQMLVTMLEHEAPAATRIGDALQGHAERVVDHLYERVIQAFGVLFIAVLLIVLISRLLGAFWRGGLQEEPLRGTRWTKRGPKRGAGHAKPWRKRASYPPEALTSMEDRK